MSYNDDMFTYTYNFGVYQRSEQLVSIEMKWRRRREKKKYRMKQQ